MRYALAALLLCLITCPALGHVTDRPDLDSWAMQLKSRGGTNKPQMICCGMDDAYEPEQVDSDGGHYRFLYNGEWIVVPDSALVDSSNRYGRPLAWLGFIDGKPFVRCFLPGAGL